MTEIWKDIPGYEGRYQASTNGQIRSLDTHVWSGGGYRSVKGRILKLSIEGSGYLNVNLGIDNPQRIHILILSTFKGPRPKEFDGMHLDGDASNNFEGNLEWGTKSKNSQMIIHHGGRRFTVEDILFIRDHAYDYCGIQTDFAKLYNVTANAIRHIAIGKCYNYVK